MAINCTQLHLVQPLTHATKIIALETMPYYNYLLCSSTHKMIMFFMEPVKVMYSNTQILPHKDNGDTKCERQ